MKKYLTCIFSILMAFVYMGACAQDVPNKALKSSNEKKSSTSVTNSPGFDPKIAAEQKLPGSAKSDNPAKPTTPLFDPKISKEANGSTQETGSTVAKPPFDQLNDRKLETEASSSLPRETIPTIKTESKVQQSPKDNNRQPAAPSPKNVTNYRNYKGPDKQPAPARPQKVFNYRQLNVANTQPAGEQPKR